MEFKITASELFPKWKKSTRHKPERSTDKYIIAALAEKSKQKIELEE